MLSCMMRIISALEVCHKELESSPNKSFPDVIDKLISSLKTGKYSAMGGIKGTHTKLYPPYLHSTY